MTDWSTFNFEDIVGKADDGIYEYSDLILALRAAGIHENLDWEAVRILTDLGLTCMYRKSTTNGHVNNLIVHAENDGQVVVKLSRPISPPIIQLRIIDEIATEQ